MLAYLSTILNNHSNFMLNFKRKQSNFYIAIATAPFLSPKFTNDCSVVPETFEDYFSSANAEFSWLSDNFSINGSGDTLYFFSYIWLTIIFFLLYLNVGLASLLFLLEAGLLSPIASMTLIHLLPLSSILFFLNAITMESVVGVIVVLTYSRDWAVRDFTKYQVLESSLSVYQKKAVSFADSWSEYFFELRLNFACVFSTYFTSYAFILKISILWLNILIFLFKQVSVLSAVVLPNIQSAFCFINYKIPPEIFFDVTYFYKSVWNGHWFFKKSPVVLKILEFSKNQNITYLEFDNSLNILETSNGVTLYKYVLGEQNFSIVRGTSQENQRLSTYYRNRFLTEENPHNLLKNFEILSGLYFDPTFLKKNNSFQNNYKNPTKTKPVAGSNYYSKSNMTFDLKNNDYRLFSNAVDYERQCSRVLSCGYKNNEFYKIPTNKKNIFNFNLYGDSFMGKAKFRHYSLSQVLGNTEGGVYVEYNKYRNVKAKKHYINKLIDFQKLPNLVSVKKNNLSKLGETSLFYGNIVSVFNKKNKNIFVLKKLDSAHTVSLKKNYKYCAKKSICFYKKLSTKYSTVGRLSSPKEIEFSIVTFTKKILIKNNILEKRWLNIGNNNAGLGNIENYSKKINNYLVDIQLPFIANIGTLEWGSKNKHSIFSIKSRNLPWFDHSNGDELFIDKSAEVRFGSQIYKDDLYQLENKPATQRYAVENFTNHSQMADDERLIKKRRGSFRGLRKRKKNKKKFRSKQLIRGVNIKKKRTTTKSKIWKIKLNWNYNEKIEDLYKFQNRTLTGFNLEGSTYLKRLGVGQNTNPIRDYRQISKFGDAGFDNSVTSINSKQSQEFGLLYLPKKSNLLDFLKPDLFLPKKQKVNLHEKKLFSFKSISESNINNKFYREMPKQRTNNLLGNMSTQADTKRLAYYEKKLTTKNYPHFSNPESESLDDYGNLENNDFFTRSKLFWDNNSDGQLKNKTFTKFNRNKNVTDRFLKTFTKITSNRKSLISSLTNRNYKILVKNKNTLKLLQNNARMGVLENSFIKDNQVFGSEAYNMLNKNVGKLVVTEDNEVFDNNIRAGQKKPHTVYGLVWDEYLKHTYGFSLNFMDFGGGLKVSDFDNSDYSESFDFSNKNFKKKLELSSSIYDKQTGLTLDSNVGNILMTRMLSDSGFFKDIYNFDATFLYGQTPHKKNLKFIKNLKIKNDNATFSDKKKIKKYFKQALLRETIAKTNLTKQSIPYIKKFAETPTGFKYDSTSIGQKLPFIKKNITFKNEKVYGDFRAPKQKSWLNKKNETNTVLNRIVSANKSKIKPYLDSATDFKKKKYHLNLMSFYGWQLTGYLDHRRKNTIKSTNSAGGLWSTKFHYFKDKFDYNLNRITLTNNIKRNLEATKPTKNKEFLKRLQKLNKSSTNLFKKDRTKYLLNYSNFLKTNLSSETVEGGGLINNYGGGGKLDSSIFYSTLYDIRSFRNYDNFNIFEHRGVKQMRSFENKKFFDLKNLKKLNYVNYKKIVSYNDNNGDFWGKSDIVKNAKFDLNILENTMNFLNYNNSNISDNYKLANVDMVDFLGFNDTFLTVGDVPNAINLFLDREGTTNSKKTSNLANLYKTKSNTDYTSYLKNKKFSGLVDYTTNFENLYNSERKTNIASRKTSTSLQSFFNIEYYFFRKQTDVVFKTFTQKKKNTCKTLINFNKFGLLSNLKINKNRSNYNILKKKKKTLGFFLAILTIISIHIKKKKKGQLID